MAKQLNMNSAIRKFPVLFILLNLVVLNQVFAQKDQGQLHGNFQTDFQYYNEDTVIGATVPSEKMGLNSYANFNYTKGNFTAGVRYEGYFPPLNGHDQRYEGVGIPYKYLQYNTDNLDITVGNFYEQFGSGMVLRAYEEKNLGYDNAFEGVLVKYKVLEGVYVKGLVGKQRMFWDKSDGIVRGADGEISLNEAIKGLNECKLNLVLGGSFVSKFQADLNPTYNLPENVSASAGRLNMTYGGFSLYSEYAYKINDPSADNGKIYKPGEAILINASYSQKGLGIFFSAKRIDNMSFRSDRDESVANLNINYIPDITKGHTKTLAAMFPYATQLNGETGIQGEVMYKFKKGSPLGGKYGTSISINYSMVNDINKDSIIVDDTLTVLGADGTLGYESSMGNAIDELLDGDLFYSDINIEISKKFSKKFKGSLMYQYIHYDNDVIHGAGDWHGNICGHVVVIDATYKYQKKQAIRFEGQHMYTPHQYGDWAVALLEWSIPHWFFTVIDQYNYGNSNKDLAVHYPNVSVGYTTGANRIQIGYGKQRQGVMCIGGVCRNVPASNGLTLTISSSF
jgi:hypothetical protein